MRRYEILNQPNETLKKYHSTLGDTLIRYQKPNDTWKVSWMENLIDIKATKTIKSHLLINFSSFSVFFASSWSSISPELNRILIKTLWKSIYFLWYKMKKKQNVLSFNNRTGEKKEFKLVLIHFELFQLHTASKDYSKNELIFMFRWGNVLK